MRKCVGLIVLIGWLAGSSVFAADQKNQIIVFNSITFNENWRFVSENDLSSNFRL